MTNLLTSGFRELKEEGALRRVLQPVRGLIVALFVFSMFMNVLMLTGPLYMLQIYDRVLPSGSIETLFALTLLAAILYGASGCLDFVRTVILRHLGHRLEREVGPVALRGVIAAAVASPGRRSDQPMRDLKALRQFISSQAPVALFDLPWAPFYLLVTFMLHWLLGLIALVSMVILVALAWANRAASEASIAEGNVHSLQSSAMAASFVRNAEALLAMGMGRSLTARWQALEGRAFSALTKGGTRASQYAAASRTFRLFAQSIILGAGALLAVDQVLTPGTMIAASILLGRALAPIDQTVGQWTNFITAIGAQKRLRAFLAAAPKPVGGLELPAPTGRVTVERLYGGPPGMSKAHLQNIAFSLDAGQALGIIGPSASGKSTLARHLVGLYTPAEGAVRLDGADVARWDRDQLGRYIGYLPQDVEILSGTVAENISRFEENPAAEAIVEAARLARVHEMILRLPNGYDTEVGEWGVHLSAGQRQRLALARAVYGRPALIVLDEPNSNLDAEGEAALNECIASLKARAQTVIVVGHRPSSVAQVDFLLVLEEGRMRAFGPRPDIMAKFMALPAGRANVSSLRIASDGTGVH